MVIITVWCIVSLVSQPDNFVKLIDLQQISSSVSSRCWAKSKQYTCMLTTALLINTISCWRSKSVNQQNQTIWIIVVSAGERWKLGCLEVPQIDKLSKYGMIYWWNSIEYKLYSTYRSHPHHTQIYTDNTLTRVHTHIHIVYISIQQLSWNRLVHKHKKHTGRKNGGKEEGKEERDVGKSEKSFPSRFG